MSALQGTREKKHPQLVEDLLRPGMELIETHISWVFLQGQDAWKVKKPVDFGFLDFTTAHRRHEACIAEVELNRRLAPDVYLGCVPITRDSEGHARFGGSGEPVDWAVQMARLSEADRADILLARGALAGSDLKRVAEHLAGFHRDARCDEETTRFGSVEVIRANVEENFAQTKDELHRYLAHEQVEEIQAWQRGFLDRELKLFQTRQARGRIRDGHGDLRLEHLYFVHPSLGASANETAVTIVDCIEFNDRFRFADVCADVAFLAMDLAWHGRADLAECFLAAYARAANDFDLYPLVDFYESYRAFVRGKIASFGAVSEHLSYDSRQRIRSQARRYFLLALASERRGLSPSRLIAVGGIIASGKSTVADQLGVELALPVIDADRTRKFLSGVAPDEPIHERAFQGRYSEAATSEVYSELFRRADAVLRSGRGVVLDASFRSRENRLAARALAQRHGVPFLFLECRAEVEICRRRLEERARHRGVSDGRLEIFADFVASWEPIEELPGSEHRILDTTLPVDENLRFLRDDG